MKMWKIVKDGVILGYDSNEKDAWRLARLLGATVKPAEEPKTRQITLMETTQKP